MRIVINVNEKTVNHRRRVTMRIGYNLDGRDSMMVRNAGVEVYNELSNALNESVENCDIECEGERR